MKNFCCVADFNFLNRVVALDKSLKKYSEEYALHLLCLDKKIFESDPRFEEELQKAFAEIKETLNDERFIKAKKFLSQTY